MERGGLELLSNPLRDASSNALYWRANALFRQWDEASNREAIKICEQLVEIIPGQRELTGQDRARGFEKIGASSL